MPVLVAVAASSVVWSFCGFDGTAFVVSRAPETSCVTTPRSPKMMSSSLPTPLVVAAAALAEDDVVARAAGEVVAGLAADDQVVARTAVDREADLPECAGRIAPVEQVGVDDVVAAELVRVREREDEERRAVADAVQDRDVPDDV